VDLTETPEREAFRAEVRAWLAANVPSPALPSLDTAEGFAAHRDWERRLYDARLAVVTWPQRYGGRDADLLDWLVFEEEYWSAGAPVRVSQNGIFLLAPTMFEFATEAQLDRFMVPMARADEVWAQGWSEPGAGSDLAALRSRADRDEAGGGWRINGQKTWSTRAAYADWMFGLFRTDPESSRHRGLTYLLLPLDADGVTVRPIRQLDGEPGFAEVFFDDVFVPDDQVLGGVGQGWAVAMSTTTSERGLTLRSPGRFMAPASRLLELAARTPTAPAVDDAVETWMDADAYRLYVLSTALEILAGRPIGAESSANKLFWSQLDIRLHETALRLLGEDATLTSGDDAGWLDGFLFSLAGPIYAGTNEIQRNVVAERVLKLPKGA
jgi:alkylation response protein AidB-like acyl-CoA dehydrogenase